MSRTLLPALALLACAACFQPPNVGLPGTDAGADAGSTGDGGTLDSGQQDGGADAGADGGFEPAPDAGRDGGTDGGAGPQSCSAPADCAGDPPDVRGCLMQPITASCIAGACLWECPGGRTCKVTPGTPSCLNCDNAPAACAQTTCAPGNFNPVVGFPSCELLPGTQHEMDNLRLDEVVGASCRRLVHVSGTNISVGSFVVLTDQSLLADFPIFGGYCVGRYLPTGALRIQWSCPTCAFVVTY